MRVLLRMKLFVSVGQQHASSARLFWCFLSFLFTLCAPTQTHMLLNLLLLAFGIALLVVGAEFLVRGASRLASMMGMTSLVVGLTIVAFGTSAPELAVSIGASLSGRSDLAVGNVVGSNILNVLLILGASAAIVPLVVSRQLVRVDVPIMVGVSVLAWVLSMDGSLGRIDGAVLFSLIVAYIFFTIWQSRRSNRRDDKSAGDDAAATALGASDESETKTMQPKLWVQCVMIVGGLVLLVTGARAVVHSSVEIARVLGVSELVIGLTIVAAGTSLPEVAASLVAAIRGERDIAVGNVVGSNIFNVLAILGAAAIVAPGGSVPISSAVLRFDFPVMTAVAVACLPIFFTGYSISRWEGFLFLGYYIAYLTFVIFSATDHYATEALGIAILYFALPLTVVTLLVTVSRRIKYVRALRLYMRRAR